MHELVIPISWERRKTWSVSSAAQSVTPLLCDHLAGDFFKDIRGQSQGRMKDLVS